MKLYVWIIGLSFLMLLSLGAYASTPNFQETQPCQQVALAMASEVLAGEATKAEFVEAVQAEENVTDLSYKVEVVGGKGQAIQSIMTTVRVFTKDGVAYCDG